MRSLLLALQHDWRKGLLVEIADAISAETFDAFIDHATRFQKSGKRMEAGVLVSVVFEDAIRRLGRRHDQKEREVDKLIDDLVKAGVFTPIKAKRLKSTAGLRNHALHAEWDAYDLRDVSEAITTTRELIERLAA